MTLLDTLLLELRAELKAETPTVLHSHAAPALRDSDGLPETRWPDSGGLGPPFTAATHRFLGHSDHWGTSRIGMESIMEVSAWCAPRHPTHRRPYFARTFCGELVFQAAYLGQSVDDLAWLHGAPVEAIEGMLLHALRHAAEWRLDRYDRMRRAAPMLTPERRPYKPAA